MVDLNRLHMAMKKIQVQLPDASWRVGGATDFENLYWPTVVVYDHCVRHRLSRKGLSERVLAHQVLKWQVFSPEIRHTLRHLEVVPELERLADTAYPSQAAGYGASRQVHFRAPNTQLPNPALQDVGNCRRIRQGRGAGTGPTEYGLRQRQELGQEPLSACHQTSLEKVAQMPARLGQGGPPAACPSHVLDHGYPATAQEFQNHELYSGQHV